MTREKYVKICPKCKSIDVGLDATDPLQGSLGLPAMYVCYKCDYTNQVFPEIAISKLETLKDELDENKEEKSKKQEPNELVDTSYGNFIVKKYWKVVGLIMMFMGFLIFAFRDMRFGLPILIFGVILYRYARKKRQWNKKN